MAIKTTTAALPQLRIKWQGGLHLKLLRCPSPPTALCAMRARTTARSPTKIGDVIVSFPVSLQQQKRLVAEFASISSETQRLTRIYECKLAALEELKKSLLHQAFNGEL